MLLQLDDKFRISKDKSGLNFTLEQLVEIKDKIKGGTKLDWLLMGYHGNSISSVLKQYKKEAVFAEEFDSINLILKKLDQIDETIKKVVKKENIYLDVKSDD